MSGTGPVACGWQPGSRAGPSAPVRAGRPPGAQWLPPSPRRCTKIFDDEQFAAAFGTRGAPAESPGALALVTVLQYVENLTDRQAGLMVARAIDWKYALGLELTDPGFDPSVLSKFRARLVEHGLERVVFDKMLEVLAAKGLVGAGGKQRTDSTHVASAVRDLNRLELAGESVRACLEALAAAAPDCVGSGCPR
jgi:transposase